MKVGLVLEGGSMRALYSSGILDTMMDYNITIDGIIGVSAGALFGPNFFSNQKGRALRYNKRFCRNWRFISMASFLFTGNIVNKQFAYYDMTYIHDPFDEETFKNNKKDFYVTVTNIETAQAEYLKFVDVKEGLELLRASAALPFFSNIVEIVGNKYLDGGISDSVPLKKCKELGYDKIIVILTQPKSYKKGPFKKYMMNAVKIKYHRYPRFVELMENRYIEYNKNIEYVNDLESQGDVFVFRPNKVLDIGTIERNPDHIQEIYDLGVEDANVRMSELIEYLEK